jgi:hypothetical protein
VRLDKELVSLLSEGRRRTPLNKQELVRRTLRLHLRTVIESEANVPATRLTTLSPWPRGALAKAYKRTDKEREQSDGKATAAQGKPSWED